MNNKGFTLVELLAAVSILAIISVIAVPKIIDTFERNKKDAYINDAKKFYALVEYSKRKNSSLRNKNKVYFNDIDASDIDKSPSEKDYSSGYVEGNNICLSDGVYMVSGTLADLSVNGVSRFDKVTKNSNSC